MRSCTTALTLAPLIAFAVVPLTARAQLSEGTFLTDYSKLVAAPDNPFEEIYVSPDAQKHATQYTAVMIDQPEIFVNPNSKYKGMKPDDMKAIADALRTAVTDELKSGYHIVDSPGHDVLYVRLAVGDLMLQKKKRPILAYTPAGAVIYAGVNLARSTTSKVDLKNMKIEGEVLDSVTHEQLGAMTTSRGTLSAGSDSTKPVSWKELNSLFTLVGKRLRCRLDNARLPQDQWSKCGEIGLALSQP